MAEETVNANEVNKDEFSVNTETGEVIKMLCSVTVLNGIG